jgi:hypothetical protein
LCAGDVRAPLVSVVIPMIDPLGTADPVTRPPDRAVKAAQSPLRRLFVQASHYSAANLLTTAAGLITFPLMTRIFTVADYGVMNLISATLTVSVAL